MIRIITSTITGCLDPAIAIAGSKAGGIGILDVTFCDNASIALASLNKLAHYATNEYGIKINAVADHFFLEIASSLPPQLTTVILAAPKPDHLEEAVSILRQHKLTLLLECTSLQDASLGQQCAIDAFIAKGNEAGGKVGEETAFVLLQKLKASISEPIWVQGGIGLHTASACHMAGAAGIVLDAQLCLTRESPLSPIVQNYLRQQDGRKTQLIGEEIGDIYRIQSLSTLKVKEELLEIEQHLCQQPLDADKRISTWRRHLADGITTSETDKPSFLMLGQDIAIADSLADTFVTVGGIVQGIQQRVKKHCRLMSNDNPFSSDSALAKNHGTEFSIVQGPMARVSDTPQFALNVAEAGGLPFLAAAWLRRDELNSLFAATTTLLDRRPWGVGLLGFLPSDVFAEQVEVLIQYRPPFALLAGGQPHQAKRLEKEGIKTYIHIPTVSFLDMFIDQGLRRFIFEGREAGGHVGPFCGFVLWETMIQRLLVHAGKLGSLQGFHILFAGGIKDSLSAAMIAAMAAPLTAKGASIGLQIGSAYLFTTEAVTSGAIVSRYQQQMLSCQQTTLLETGPGHAVRCVTTPFTERFLKEKRRLLAEKVPFEQAKQILEGMERGRLRIASKGVTRTADVATQSKLTTVDEAAQYEEGVYMVGQMASLQTAICSIAELHNELALNSFQKIKEKTADVSRLSLNAAQAQPLDIAIIGVSGFFPLATDTTQYWSNIVNKVSAIREIPKERWDYSLLFNEDRYAPDRIYAKWGTFLDDVPFDPLHYGMPPKMIPSVEPLHLIALESVRYALLDAGYDRRPFDRERTAVTMGISGAGDLAQLYGFRTMLPMFFGEQSDDIVKHFQGRLPEWTEDSFPGILMNVASGRIANRFDFGGMNTLIDGACASSLAAVYSAVKELETGSCDLAIAGGADCMQNPFTYMCFSKTHALSPRGVCNSLDAKADGIVIGESVVSVVLKRLSDAERDGDRIYGVIKGMGASSDGKDRSLTAPGVKGQMRALNRAYAKAGFSAATVGLFEAHATGTVEGDKVEIESLSQILLAENAPPRSCAVGSVKSMIGHTKSAAGLASMVKTVLALHHKVLPPTSGVETPNPGLQKNNSPLYANGVARPWFSTEHPRRAGINAFGFGGTNYHTVIEEYTGAYYQIDRPASYQDWPTELFRWQAIDSRTLSEALLQFKSMVNRSNSSSLKDLAHANALENHHPDAKSKVARLAIIATNREDLLTKIDQAITELTASPKQFTDPRGLFYHLASPLADGQIALVFPGQGSQYVDMLADLAIQFPFIHELFERSDQLLDTKRATPLSSVIFPAQVYTETEQREQAVALAQTTTAQPAMGTADLAIYHILTRLGIKPDMVAGHSYGEYVALCAAGAFDEEDLIALSEARARFILAGTGDAPGIMAAIEANAQRVEEILAKTQDVWIANINAPDQVVISGTNEAVLEAMKRFESQEIKSRKLPVGCAFHSPLIEPACAPMTEYLAALPMQPPKLPVFSNVTASLHPDDPATIKENMVKQLVNRVRFVEQIENMYQAGTRIFVECGPGRVLSALVNKILGDRPHVSVVTNQRGRSAFTQLHFALAELFIHGVQANLAPLFAGRSINKCDQPPKKLTPTTWLVNGSGARPATEPAPLPITPFTFSGNNAPFPTPLRTGNDHTMASSAPQPSPENRDAALIGFQQLMRHFLDTQQSVMAHYLSASGDAGDQVATNQMSEPKKEALPATAPVVADTTALEQTEAKPSSPPHDPEAELMAVVSARTGYPPEMIDLDRDMEADLGIDSIKRVEILGEFLKSRDTNGETASSRTEVEKARTLRQILDWARATEAQKIPARAKDSSLAPQEKPSVPTQQEPIEQKNSFLPRCLVVPKPLLHSPNTLPLPTSYPILITDDGRGIAEALAEIFAENGNEVLLLRNTAEQPQSSKWTEYSLVATDTEPLAALIRKNHRGISGLIHLSPLQPQSTPFAEMSATEWHQRLVRDLKPLFDLLQYFATDLQTTQGVVAAVTAMGGNFGLDNSGQENDFFPGHGAIPGFIKTLAIEWPKVRAKAIDISLAESVKATAKSLFAELLAADDTVEVGLVDNKRYGLGGQLAPLQEATTIGLNPEQDWVIVVTGGARGITARIAIELAKQSQPTLVLLGRSPAPTPDSDHEFDRFSSAMEIKQAIIQRSQEQKQSLTIAEVEKSCRRILAAREIREAITKMEQAGSRVVYHQTDVSNPTEFSALLTTIHQQYGRLDGIIHGAGIIEDKLFVDKKWESFSRVFFTKADSTWTLAHSLPKISPRFIALFSSVAGTFGNRGQCDYAAANEVMNKTALWLSRNFPCRVVALNWGPWAGSGMASPEVQEQFRKRQVHLVGQDEGAQAFVREITYGKQNEVEVLLGDGPWVTMADQPMTSTNFPLLHGSTLTLNEGQTAVVHLMLDPLTHLYLNDHRLDGKPVLPAAVAVEIMAETAATLNPGWQVAAIRDIRVLKGIVIEHERRQIVISVKETVSADNNKKLTIGISEEEGGRLFYSGTVELHQHAPTPAYPPLPQLVELKPLEMTVNEAYDKWLFHGHLFQCITAIDGINDHSLRATIKTSLPEQCLLNKSAGNWLADPVLLDGGLQLALIWTRFHRDMTMLPSAMAAVHLYRPFSLATEVTCQLEVVESLHQHGIIFNLYFLDQAGVLLGMIERLEATGSKELNRLTAKIAHDSEGGVA